jgi:hypothetical protein
VKRRWLLLFFLAPALGELLTGSTPPLKFFNPVSLVLEGGLYGSGAILARELVRRRGLGWASLLLLGAAYGVLEEGVVLTSWLDPHWPVAQLIGGAGRLLEIDWIWAAALTTFHAVVSVTAAVLLAETIFPDGAGRPWARGWTLRLHVALLAAVSAIGLAGFGFLSARRTGYSHPPGAWWLAVALMLGLAAWGLLRPPRPAPPTGRVPPGPWRLRLAGFGAAVAWFLGLYALPHLPVPGVVPVLFLVGLGAGAALTVRRWAAGRGWSGEHRLALAAGVLAFLAALLLVREPATHTGGALVAVATLALLAWLSRRAGAGPPAAVPTTAQAAPATPP